MLEIQDFIDFSIHSWYERFKHITLETELLEMPPELKEKFKTNESHFDIEEVSSPTFVDKLQSIINKFNKNAFVKSNWHAPIDIKMLSFGNQLKVTNISDLSLYLSTSDIITEDFAFQKSSLPLFIVLRPWKNIHPASEFRCIVINEILRGITPRDWPTYYSHFKEEGPGIIDALLIFYKTEIAGKFPRKHFTFDVILTYPDTPCLVDFGPLNNKSNLYAFSWKEISPLLNKEVPEETAPIFRYLDSDIGIISKHNPQFKNYS